MSRPDVAVNPGRIDNTALLENGILKNGLKETSYKLVPAQAWDNLLAWYGVTEDSVEIKRQVTKRGYDYKVEIYHLEVKTSIYPDNSCIQSIFITRCDTIHSQGFIQGGARGGIRPPLPACRPPLPEYRTPL